MSLHVGVVTRRHAAILVAVAFALCLPGTYAAAQVTIQPQDEVYAGYSWLHPGGHYDDGLKTNDVTNGVDISNVYYLPFAHNLGVMLDASGHWGSSYFNGLGHATDYYGLAGLQYKYHTDTFSPFFRVYAGAIHQIPPGFYDRGSQWNAALGAGGGFDYYIGHRIGIRVVQADYIYSNYNQVFQSTSKQWNSLRLSAGLLWYIGNYYAPTPTAACSAQPTEVTEGEPVTVTANGSNFNPKHTVTYAWTTNGGKLDTANAQSAHIDTTGVAAGSYAANATITDPKMKKGGSATCAANYTVKAKPMNPPQVSCSANPSTVQAGTPSTITVTASSPDNANITSYSYTASAGQISGTGTSATLDTAGLPSGPVTVTASATDARNLTGSGTCTVSVEAPPPPPMCSKVNSIQFPDKRRPWRVDNTAKAILDDVASRMKQDPNAKIVIIGYADGEKAPMEGTGKKRHPMDLAAQRAVNAKAYLVQQQGIDPSRIEVRSGTGQSMTADIIWVPQGADENNATTCPQLQNTTPVDESVVKPSENAYPKPRNAAPAHHHARKAKPAEGAAQQ
ncbi:MAG TPA: OmpA family protein [Bryocella sp.]|nr:OmpA family protein [Bryocella sp.]